MARRKREDKDNKIFEMMKDRIAHAPRTPATCHMLLELLLSAPKEERPDLLQVMVEDFHYTESDALYTIPIQYNLHINERLKKIFEEKIFWSVRIILKRTGGKREFNFYNALYYEIFENDSVFETYEHKAYALYLICTNPALPYVCVEGMKKPEKYDCLEDDGSCFELEDVEKAEICKRLRFLTTYPSFQYYSKAKLMFREINKCKRKNRVKALELIIENYEKQINEMLLMDIDKIII